MSAASSGVKKMKQGMSYSCKEKTIIMNVYKYFRAEYPDNTITDIVRQTSRATGCSEKSIFLFKKEENTTGFKEPTKTKTRKKVSVNARMVKYDESIREIIRNAIHDLERKNKHPSLRRILERLKEIDSVPEFSLMTLRRLLNDMGFSYQKNGNKINLVIETNDKENSFEERIPFESNNLTGNNEANNGIIPASTDCALQTTSEHDISGRNLHSFAHDAVLNNVGNSQATILNMNSSRDIPLIVTSRAQDYSFHLHGTNRLPMYIQSQTPYLGEKNVTLNR